MKNSPDQTSRNAALSLGLRLSGAALGMLVHIALARLLSVADYGLFSIGLTIATLASVFASVGMPFCAVRFLPTYIAQNETAKARLFECTSLYLTAAGIAMFTGAGVLVYWLALPLLPPTVQAGLVIALPLFIVLGFSQTQHSLLIARGFIVRGDLLQTVARPALIVIIVLGVAALVTVPDLTQIVVIWTGVSLFVMLLMWRAYPFAQASAAPLPDPALTRSWVRVGFVIMLTATGTAMMERLDILVIGLFLSAEDVAVYSVASRIALIGTIAINAANAAFGPSLSVAVSARNAEDIRKGAHRATLMSTLSLALFILILAVAGTLILAVFGPNYQAGWSILMVLGVAQLLVATFGATGGITVFAGGERVVVTTMGVALACNLALNLLLVPMFGPIGAAIASLLALMFLQIRLAIWCHVRLGVPTNLWTAVFSSFTRRPGQE